ncbi:MAG: DNA/RNA non-specific endonuclease [Bacteroidales bacterium]|nr:DNA/RNA non-specific endonuclease [Bacteroidales bacterium]
MTMNKTIAIFAIAALFTMCGPENGNQPEQSEAGVTVVTGSATGVTTSTATLNATFSDNTAPVIDAGFNWGTSEDNLDGIEKALNRTSPFSVPLSDLAEDRTYYYRAYVILQIDATAKVFYGEIKSFKTRPGGGDPGPGPDDPPQPQEMSVTVMTGSASNITISDAVISGSYANATDQVREVGFEWGTSSSSLTEIAQSEYTDSPFDAGIDGLGNDMLYYYRAYVILQRDSEIKTFYGSVSSFRTLKDQDIPEPPSGSQMGWYELPKMNIQKSGNFHYNSEDNTQYYAWHLCSGGEKGPGGKTARNYTVCYSATHHCPLWVAAPRHSMYEVKNTDRTDAYRRDPLIPSDIQYSTKKVGDSSGCNKGHMLGSEERLCSENTNKDVFYFPNIAPQLSKFNTGGGGWNILEEFVDGQVCSDTLYVVIGCYFKSFRHVYKGGITVSAEPETLDSYCGRSDVSKPTMFYYVLLRTKRGNTGKALKDCSATEIKCAAFVRTHSNSLKGVDVTSYDMMTVSDLEALTGVEYFPNVPNAPKSTMSASDWGL